jgi:hypothetical protein
MLNLIMETFKIVYRGKPVEVRVDVDYYSITKEPVYFIDLPEKTLYIEMGDDGFWCECEGDTTQEIQELGELIEEQDY